MSSSIVYKFSIPKLIDYLQFDMKTWQIFNIVPGSHYTLLLENYVFIYTCTCVNTHIWHCIS